MITSINEYKRFLENNGDEILGTTYGYGEDKSGEGQKNIYMNFDHPAHTDFDYRDHEAAEDLHRSAAYKIHRDVLNQVSPNLTKLYRKPSAVQQKQIDELLKGTKYNFHKEQEALHRKKSEELYEPIGKIEDLKIAQRKADSAKAEAEQRKVDAEKLKSMSEEDKQMINKLNTKLKSLAHHHPADSINFGVSIAEERRKLRDKIQQIKNKYLK